MDNAAVVFIRLHSTAPPAPLYPIGQEKIYAYVAWAFGCRLRTPASHLLSSSKSVVSA